MGGKLTLAALHNSKAIWKTKRKGASDDDRPARAPNALDGDPKQAQHRLIQDKGGTDMNTFKTLFGSDYIKVKLSLLWLFVMLNYIYADILTLMDASALNEILTGSLSGGVEITPTFLLLGAILMEVPIAMVVLSLVLERRINRWANIFAGAIKTLAVSGTMFVGVPALYYLFFGAIEIAATIHIIWLAWTWKSADTANAP